MSNGEVSLGITSEEIMNTSNSEIVDVLENVTSLDRLLVYGCLFASVINVIMTTFGAWRWGATHPNSEGTFLFSIIGYGAANWFLIRVCMRWLRRERGIKYRI